MNVSLKISRIFFAISLVAWGIQHFITGEFITGRAPAWPTILPGKEIFAYLTGLILIVCGVAIIVNKKPILSGLVVGGMILLCAALPNVYLVISKLDYAFLLTSMNKALTLGFGAILVVSTFYIDTDGLDMRTAVEQWVEILAPFAKYAMGFFLLVSGVQHFLFAAFIKFLIPTWIPLTTFWVYFSGVALAAGGLGLLTGIQRTLAATLSGWMIFIWLLVLHIPRALTAGGNMGEWTAVFEALAVSGLLFIVAEQKK